VRDHGINFNFIWSAKPLGWNAYVQPSRPLGFGSSPGPLQDGIQVHGPITEGDKEMS